MKELFIAAFIIFIFSEATIANDFFGLAKQEKKTKDEYSHSKCLVTHNLYQANLTHEEICKYGVSCPQATSEKKIKMYCLEPDLSDCFKNFSWKSSNQLLDVPESKTIGLFSISMSIKGGVESKKVCAYLD